MQVPTVGVRHRTLSGNVYDGIQMTSFGDEGLQETETIRKPTIPESDSNSTGTTPDENSPIPEVASAIPNTDNPDTPSLTFRFWVLGMFFSIILPFVNQFFWFRTNPIAVNGIVISLISYPMGKFMDRVLPATNYDWFGYVWTMNPGPFNVKEHVLITIIANCAASTAYAMDIVVIQKMFYHQDSGFLYGILLILTTQCIGYGMAGALRKYLVWPAAMVWPTNLVACTMLLTLHSEGTEAGRQRLRFFGLACGGYFLYYWLPGYLFPVLASMSWLCWFNNSNVTLSQIASGPRGLGFLSFPLDWNVLTSYLGSPLVTPFWATANIFAGFVIITWIMVPIAYYNNLWDAQKFPILNSKLYTTEGKPYGANSLLTEDKVLDEELYAARGPLRITTFFALTYGVGFAALTAVLTHTWLYSRKDIVAQYRAARGGVEDIHTKLMKVYPEVPQWWYLLIGAISLVFAIITVEVYPTHLPWWGVVLAVALSAFFCLPIGIIQAVTNQQLGLNILTEFIIGLILPGRPIANVVFKTYGYISMVQALSFVGDLKLGHYMKIPPRHMFIAQVLGTVIAAFINLGTGYWLMETVPNICTDQNAEWQCLNAGVFFSASVIWGLIGPARMFGPESIYNPVLYFFLFGALLPIPFYYLGKRYPTSWVKYINIPVILTATAIMPPAKTIAYPMWCLIGFIFQYVIRRRYKVWFDKYNYVLSAGLDSGLTISTLLIFFALQYQDDPNIEWFWWGKPNTKIDTYGDHCPLGGSNAAGIDWYNRPPKH